MHEIAVLKPGIVQNICAEPAGLSESGVGFYVLRSLMQYKSFQAYSQHLPVSCFTPFLMTKTDRVILVCKTSRFPILSYAVICKENFHISSAA